MTISRRWLYLFLLLCISAWAATVYGSWGSSGWRSAGTLPYPRWMGGAALGGDGKIYVMGGYVFAPYAGTRGDNKPDRGYGRGKFALDIFDPKTGRSELGPPVEDFEYVARMYVGQSRLKGLEVIEEEPVIRDQIFKVIVKDLTPIYSGVNEARDL